MLASCDIPVRTVVNPDPAGEKRVCLCVAEPRGCGGLEGVGLDGFYLFQRCPVDVNGRPYVRVFHDASYYETCSVSTFDRFFVEVEKDGA